VTEHEHEHEHDSAMTTMTPNEHDSAMTTMTPNEHDHDKRTDDAHGPCAAYDALYRPFEWR
jgi:hypothetical protein